MNRTFGSGLNAVLFEPNLADLSSTAEFIIRDAAAQWVPHVVIDRVQIARNEKVMTLRVSFHLVEDDAVSDRLVELDRSAIVQFLGLQGV